MEVLAISKVSSGAFEAPSSRNIKKSKITLILYGVFSNFFLKLPGKMKIYSFGKRCVI